MGNGNKGSVFIRYRASTTETGLRPPHWRNLSSMRSCRAVHHHRALPVAVHTASADAGRVGLGHPRIRTQS